MLAGAGGAAGSGARAIAIALIPETHDCLGALVAAMKVFELVGVGLVWLVLGGEQGFGLHFSVVVEDCALPIYAVVLVGCIRVR